MNVVYVHTGLWPSNSPSFTFVTYNAIGLASEFGRCYLVVKNNGNEKVESILNSELNTIKPNNLEIVLISNSFINKSNFIYSFRIQRRIESIIKNEKIDVIITRNPRILGALVKFKRKYGINVYFESHDFYADLSLRNDIKKGKKNKISWSERTYIPLISGVICLQNPQKELYKKSFPNSNIYLARTGINSVVNQNIEMKYLTYIGSLDQHKGLEQLLKALYESETKPPLLIIGGKNHDEINKFTEIASKYYDPSLLTITGWIGKKQMHEYLLRTAIGVLPLNDTFFNRYLTSPLKLFDYYSFSIPVIASHLPTTNELIINGRTGFLIEEGNIKIMAEKIDYVFNNLDILDDMRLEVFNFASTLLWTKRANTLKQIFIKNS